MKSNKSSIPCFRCGICCAKYQVHLTLPEAKGLARNLGISLTEFVSNYTDPRWPGTKTFLIRQENSTCVFLKQNLDTKVTGCRIHPFRPQDCRNWTPGLQKPECQQGLSLWNLYVDTSGKLNGTTENRRKFRLFVESIKTD